MLLIYVDMRDKYVYMKIINVNNRFAHIQLQLSLSFFVLDIRTYSVWDFSDLMKSIGLLCTGVKYLILTENKYTR